MLRPVAESSAHEVVKKQSQTRCPRCGAWSAADRCPQCGAHRMSAGIGVHPEEEMQD
jgi:DNA-directed RNA polymerase subunit RPC12/RpoP